MSEAQEKFMAATEAFSVAIGKLDIADQEIAMRFASSLMQQLVAERDAINMQIRGTKLRIAFAELREGLSQMLPASPEERPQLGAPTVPELSPNESAPIGAQVSVDDA